MYTGELYSQASLGDEIEDWKLSNSLYSSRSRATMRRLVSPVRPVIRLEKLRPTVFAALFVSTSPVSPEEPSSHLGNTSSQSLSAGSGRRRVPSIDGGRVWETAQMFLSLSVSKIASIGARAQRAFAGPAPPRRFHLQLQLTSSVGELVRGTMACFRNTFLGQLKEDARGKIRREAGDQLGLS